MLLEPRAAAVFAVVRSDFIILFGLPLLPLTSPVCVALISERVRYAL